MSLRLEVQVQRVIQQPANRVPVSLGDAPQFLVALLGDSDWYCLAHAVVAHGEHNVACCLLLCQAQNETIFRAVENKGKRHGCNSSTQRGFPAFDSLLAACSASYKVGLRQQ
jgi:hypothetical protein